MNDNPWSVYIVKCSDGSFYCGISNRVEIRIANHNKGLGARYTKTRRPVVLIAEFGGLTKIQAMKLERKVKKQPKLNKIDYLLKRGQYEKTNDQQRCEEEIR